MSDQYLQHVPVRLDGPTIDSLVEKLFQRIQVSMGGHLDFKCLATLEREIKIVLAESCHSLHLQPGDWVIYKSHGLEHCLRKFLDDSGHPAVCVEGLGDGLYELKDSVDPTYRKILYGDPAAPEPLGVLQAPPSKTETWRDRPSLLG